MHPNYKKDSIKKSKELVKIRNIILKKPLFIQFQARAHCKYSYGVYIQKF